MTLSRPLSVRAHEVGGVVDPDRLLTAIFDGLEGAGCGERLDRRRIQAAVHESPRLVVALVGGDRPTDAGRANFLDVDLEQLHQLARGDQRRDLIAGAHTRCRIVAGISILLSDL